MATRPNSGMDPSPLLPLGVLLVVVVMVFTPITLHVLPMFMDTAQQMLALFWILPVFLVAALFVLTSSELIVGTTTSRPYTYRRPVYRYPQTHYGNDGPRWGLLGLMLLLLLLLPWRY